MALESEATSRYEFSVSTVPGLLQTEDYAREVLRAASYRGAEELEGQVAARLARQDWLLRDDLPVYRAILDEAVLMRFPKESKAWQLQLAHLVDVAEMPNVTLQVLPFSAGLHGLVGTSLTLLWLPDGKSVAYTEDAFSGDLDEHPEPVGRMRLAYDLVRDVALSPRESMTLVKQVAEDSPRCNPPE
ncbi:DUF5753 domain-containing protein [Streptomyces ehimensis]